MAKIFFLLLLLISNISYTNPILSDHSQLLLMKTSYFGFTPDGVIRESSRITIWSNGEVFYGYRESYDSSWHHRVIQRLSQAEIINIQSKLRDLAPGEFSAPDEPGYSDEPSAIYTGRSKSGHLIPFMDYHDGLWGKLKDFLWAEDLRIFLDSFEEQCLGIRKL